jgi:cytoskeletal protein CcmA (bactofilin family)
MAIWKEQTAPPRKDAAPPVPEALRKDSDMRTDLPSAFDTPRRAASNDGKESMIAAGLTVEGKIEGAGHIRIAGRFQGDVHVQGNLTIEAGAKVTGGVRAATVVIGGELEGNVDGAQRVELLDTGILNGNLKAGSLTVAAGSRMRGQVEFGWEEKVARHPELRMETGSTT